MYYKRPSLYPFKSSTKPIHLLSPPKQIQLLCHIKQNHKRFTFNEPPGEIPQKFIPNRPLDENITALNLKYW